MTSNFKALGVVLGAAMAMSAMMASAASAVPQFTASSYPATVTSSNTKGNEVFTTEAGKVECDSHFVSHSLGAASSTLTVTPTYTNCEAFGLGATVNTEGCTYVFHATERISTGVYNSHIDLACAAGKSIKWVTGGGLCRTERKSQTGLTTVKTTNVAGGSITVEWNVSSIAYTVTTDGFGCPFSGTGTKTDGKHTGHLVISRVGGGSVEVSGT